MGAVTGIEWTHHTFNPWWGCTKVSLGCANCYAERDSVRYGKTLWGPKGSREARSDRYWSEPLKWAKAARAAGERRRVFCASMADVFEDREDVKPHRARLARLIEATPDLDWLLLTKRPENVDRLAREAGMQGSFFAGNIWIGASVEDQARADERIPLLLDVPARVRFLSCEPLLGPIELPRFISLQRPVMSDVVWIDEHKYVSPGGAPIAARAGIQRVHLNRNGARSVEIECGNCRGEGCPGENPYPCRAGKTWLGIKPDECVDLGLGISWVIVGGESGPNARPMHPDWARSLRDQCAAAGVPFFFKQWGEWSPRGPEEWGYELNDTVPRMRLSIDGRNGQTDPQASGGDSWIQRVGKKAAGSLLDGRDHKAVPT